MPVVLGVIFLLVSSMGIPTIFFVGKEAVLLIFDEITRGTSTKQNEIIRASINANLIRNTLEEDRSLLSSNQNLANEYKNDRNFSHLELVENNTNMNIVKMVNPKEYLNMKPVYYYTLTIICHLVVVLLSITVGEVSIFYGIVGSTTGSFVTFIGPGSFYIIAVHKNNIQLTTYFQKFAYVAGWIYTIFGLISLVGLNT